MDNDVSDIMKNLNNMLDGNKIPDNVKDMLNSFMQNSNNKSNEKEANSPNDSSSNNIDINTILKIQELLKDINTESNSSRANLLRSLKPYLKPSRQEKVDQYIQLFNMEKIFKMLNTDGKS